MKKPRSGRMGAPVETLRIFRLLAWVQWRSLLARTRGLQSKSRLMIGVLGAFVLCYLVIGFWLFRFALGYLYRFPLVGSLLSQRILFLTFAFVFVMLIFSNLIIGYSTLFKSRETGWLLTLPISHRAVYRWKFVEALGLSSWALLFLSAPMMAAFGTVHEVPTIFYPIVIASYGPFVVLPAVLGSWLVLGMVRLLPQLWLKRALIGASVLVVLALLVWIKPVHEWEAVNQQDVLSFDRLLAHTRVSLNPYLPSAWLANIVQAWSEGLVRQGSFYFLVLLSNALMALWLGFHFAGRFFYASWSSSVGSRALREQRRAETLRTRRARTSWIERAVHSLRFISAPMRALALKDFRLFWRDPAQWLQFTIFFGLLCIYVLNIRNISLNFRNEFWETMISHLNLGASSLTLSTLTTRFVFPQFSLEGRRLWIIGLAPFSLGSVLMQKFWMACLVAASITVSLQVVSCVLLNMPLARVFFFAAAAGMMSVTLCSLAVALGALFPNLKEDNPTKIVSGFGGTLCLVVSCLYIGAFVMLVAIPSVRQVVQGHWIGFALSNPQAYLAAGFLSALITVGPLWFAKRRVKNLEF